MLKKTVKKESSSSESWPALWFLEWSERPDLEYVQRMNDACSGRYILKDAMHIMQFPNEALLIEARDELLIPSNSRFYNFKTRRIDSVNDWWYRRYGRHCL